MIPGDLESWHVEWMRIADRNWKRGLAEEAAGHIRTAMNCFLRAADYYRQAEFHLEPDDARRLPTFEKMEACSHKFISSLNPPGEVVEIPYEPGKPICGYFIRAPFPGEKLPVLICMGGLDSIKDEMWFMQAHGCLQRGISVLMIDGPGQGGTLRRHKIETRHDSEVPIGKCIDWLEKRDDVDTKRIAVCGSSMGGYYAARAACYEHRLAAAISHGAIWSVHDMWGTKGDDFGLAMHIKMGVRRQIDARGPCVDEAVHASRASGTHALPLSGAAWRPRRVDRHRGAEHLRLRQGERRRCDAAHS